MVSSTHSYHSLAFPEEIIHQILEHNLRISHLEFFGPQNVHTYNLRFTKKSGKRIPVPPSCSVSLLVCKRWLRIGTPLLYESVTISTLSHAKAVLEAVTVNKGICIRRLRLEGGYGKALGELSQYLHSVEHLFVYPDARCRESVSGLDRLFQTLNIRTLKIADRRNIINRNTKYINNLLGHAIQYYWPSLKQISLDSAENTYSYVIASIQRAPALEELVLKERVMTSWLYTGYLAAIINLPTFKKLICHDKRFKMVSMEFIRGRLINLTEAEKAKMDFVFHLEEPPLTEGPLSRVEQTVLWKKDEFFRKHLRLLTQAAGGIVL